MADSTDKDPTEKIVDTALQVLKTLKSTDKKGMSRWLGVSVAAVVVAIALAIVYFKAWRKGKQRAKVAHQHDVELELAHAAEVDAKLAEHEVDKKAALIESATHLAAADKLTEDLKELEREHETRTAQINALKNWDDVDRYLKR